MAHHVDKVAIEAEQLRTQLQNEIREGVASAPTTGSSQITGAGNTDWNVNLSAILAVVGGVAQHFAPAVDYDVHSGSLYTGLISGNSAIATLVALNTAGTITLAVVKGTAAVTGLQVAPTDAEIQASVGAGLSWVKVAELLLNRTADTTVTESQDNGQRPLLSINTNVDFGDWSSIADG